jgi:hypothetical protein
MVGDLLGGVGCGMRAFDERKARDRSCQADTYDRRRQTKKPRRVGRLFAVEGYSSVISASVIEILL